MIEGMETTPMIPAAPTATESSGTRRVAAVSRLRRVLPTLLPWVLVAVVVVGWALAYSLNDTFRAQNQEAWRVVTIGDQERIRTYLHGFGAWGPLVSITLMILQVILAPIPASVVQLSNGIVYGIWFGALLNLVGQMAGALLAFAISRVLGRSAAERLVGKIDEHGTIEQWLDRWGSKALFITRALPGMPSDFASYLVGLTRMPVRTYATVSLLGYVPQSIAYAWLGDSAMTWFWWIMAGGLVLSGIIAVIVWIMRRRQAGGTLA